MKLDFDGLLEAAMVVAGVYLMVQTGGATGWQLLAAEAQGAALLAAAYASHDARRRAQNAKDQYNNALQDSKHTVKAPDAARVMILGRQKVGGTLLFADSTGDQQKELHLVIAYAGHEITEYDEVWFNDTKAGTISAGVFTPIAPYGGPTTVYATGSGRAPGTYTLSTQINTTAYFAGARDYASLTAAGGVMAPATWTVKGAYANRYAAERGNTTYYADPVPFSQTGTSATFGTSTTKAGNARYVEYSVSFTVGAVDIQAYYGTDTQTADPGLMARFPTKWTSAHRLQGIAYLRIILRWSLDLFGQTGLPDITCVIRGAKVPDFTGAPDSYSNNVARCAAYWLKHPTLGANAAASELITSEWLDAQNVCDEAVSVPGGWGGAVSSLYDAYKRYTINTVISSNNSVSEARQLFEDASAGFFLWSQGRHLLRPGKYRLPSGSTQTIGDDDLAATGAKMTPKPSRQALVNRVATVYTSEVDKWSTKPCADATAAAYVADDNGLDLYQELKYDWCTNSASAERYAKLYLERNRSCKTIILVCKLYVYDLQIGDTVYLTLSRYGLSNQVAEVLGRTLDFDSMTVTLTLRMITSNIYDFTSADYNTPNPQAVTFNLPSAVAVVPQASGVTLTPKTATSLMEINNPTMVVAWSAFTDPFVIDGGYVNVYTITDQSAKFLLGRARADANSLEVSGVPFGPSTLLVVTENARGRQSDPLYLNFNTLPDVTPPSAPSNFTVVIVNGVVQMSWDDPRLLQQGYQLTLIQVGTSWATSAPVGSTTQNTYEFSWPNVGAQTYRIKHVDWAGNLSPEAVVTVTGTEYNTKVDLSAVTGFSKSGLNLIIADTWKAGVAVPWTPYGVGGNNSIISAVSQRGNVSPIWRVTSSATASWAGGFVRSYHVDQGLISIDSQKTYRVVQAVRRTGAGSLGLCYAGMNGSIVLAGQPNSICAANTTTPLNNPYYLAALTMASLPQDVWCLAVTYVYPAGSTITDVTACKLYRSDTGAVVASLGAFCFASGATQMAVRAGLYNTSGTGTTLDLMPPWIHMADGSEPSIQNLLSDTNLYSVAAYSGTVNYRNDAAPTNSPALGTITTSATVDGNIFVAVNYTYTQGALPADFLYVYKKEGGGTPTVTDYAEMSDPVSGVHYFYVKPSTVYSYGVAAARRTDSGLKVTAIIASANQAAVSGDYTSNINGVPAAQAQKNLIDASGWAPGAPTWAASDFPSGKESSIAWGIGPRGVSELLWSSTAYAPNKVYQSSVSGVGSFWFAAELGYTASTGFNVDTSVYATSPSGFRLNKAALADNGQGRATYAIALLAGETYAVSVKVRGDTATTGGVTVRINESSASVLSGAVTSANRTSYQDVVLNANVTTSFVTYSLTYTPTAGAIFASLAVIQESGGPLALYFDDPEFRRTLDGVSLSGPRENNDGGITNSTSVGNYFTVDPTKAYRFVVPVRRQASVLLPSGVTRQVTIYFGVGGSQVCNLNTTTVNTNPYFVSGNTLSGAVGSWYLFVGYVYPYGQTGLTNGSKTINLDTGASAVSSNCFNWASGITKCSVRAFQYASDEGSVVEFGKPLVHEMNGAEPSLSDLFPLSDIHNAQQQWLDVNGAPKSAMFVGGDATTLGFNGAFGGWASTLPDGYILWAGSTTNIAADYTVDSTRASDGTAAVQFTPAAGVNLGIYRAVNLTNPLPAGSLLVGSVDIKLTGTYTSGKCGLLVRLYTGPALTLPIDTYVTHPTNTTGTFQRVNWSARTANLTDQIYGIQIYIMACYTAFPGGSYVGGPVVFDNLQFNIVDKSLDNKSLAFSDTSGALTVTANGNGTVAFTAVTPNNKVTAANINSYINDLSITNAKIGNVIRSNNYDGSYDDVTGAVGSPSKGTAGWAIGKNGSMVLRAADVTGQLTTNQIQVGAATDSVTGVSDLALCRGYAWPNEAINSFIEAVTPNSAMGAGLNVLATTVTVPAGSLYVSVGLYSWTNGASEITIQQIEVDPVAMPASADYAAYSRTTYDGMLRVCSNNSTAPDTYKPLGIAFETISTGPGVYLSGYRLVKTSTSQAIGVATPWRGTKGSTTINVRIRFTAGAASSSGLYVRLFYTTSEPTLAALTPETTYSFGTLSTAGNALTVEGSLSVYINLVGDYRAANLLFLDCSKANLSLGGTTLPYLGSGLSWGGTNRDAIALGQASADLECPCLCVAPYPLRVTQYSPSTNVSRLLAVVPFSVIYSGSDVPASLSLVARFSGTLQVTNIANAVMSPKLQMPAGTLLDMPYADAGIYYTLKVLQSKL